MNALQMARIIVEARQTKKQQVDEIVRHALESFQNSAQDDRPGNYINFLPRQNYELGLYVNWSLRLAVVKALKAMGYKASTTERVGGVYLNISVPEALILQVTEENGEEELDSAS